MQPIDYLLSLPEIVDKFDLKNIQNFLDKAGNPEKTIKTIHVAGTNGKGSVCAMLSSVLAEAGYKVGLYTSPHLQKINERIKINNKDISDEELTKILEEIRRITEKNNIHLTFFETITAAAFLYFRDLDYAVLETGLGGRLDATNITQPIAEVITNIGLEHQVHLGNTIEKIAKEKAGIIKKNSILFTQAHGKALDVIKTICKEQNAKLVISEDSKIKPSLNGDFQMKNAGLAYDVLKYLNIDEKTIEKGFKNTFWPGRFEQIGNILMDAAHNPHELRMLAKEIKQLECSKIILVTAIMHDKEIKKMVKLLEPLVDTIITTQPKVRRAEPADSLASYFKNAVSIKDSKQALEKAKELAEKEDIILITGSIFLLGEIRHLVIQQK